MQTVRQKSVNYNKNKNKTIQYNTIQYNTIQYNTKINIATENKTRELPWISTNRTHKSGNT